MFTIRITHYVDRAWMINFVASAFVSIGQTPPANKRAFWKSARYELEIYGIDHAFDWAEDSEAVEEATKYIDRLFPGVK